MSAPTADAAERRTPPDRAAGDDEDDDAHDRRDPVERSYCPPAADVAVNRGE